MTNITITVRAASLMTFSILFAFSIDSAEAGNLLSSSCANSSNAEVNKLIDYELQLENKNDFPAALEVAKKTL